MTIQINENVKLELTSVAHARQLFDAIDANRTHLSRFLPWVGNMNTVDDITAYLANCEQLYQQQKEVSFVIVLNNVAVGRIGLHHLNLQNKIGAIGYWLAKSAEGQGIVTNCCKAIIDYGFKTIGLHRIEIKAAVDNFKSQAVPVKLNFSKEGVLRQAELVNNVFLDLVLYALLAHEWPMDNG